MPALKGRNVCWNHDPSQAAERAAARKRGGRLRLTHASERAPLRCAADVLREAEELLADTKQLENSGRRTTAIVGVLHLALKGLEAGEVEQRLETLEQLVGQDRWVAQQAG
jgi:hypothetical protein